MGINRILQMTIVFVMTSVLETVQTHNQPHQADNSNQPEYEYASWRPAKYNWKSPFTAFWNVPSYACSHLFNISLHLDEYGIVANKGENFTGDKVVIFYDDEFGYYPYFNKSSQPINGGLPQTSDLLAHLEKATDDVLLMIPDPAFNGIGIIDWEGWRPQWVQNFDTREIYRKQSKKLVQERHPKWSDEMIELVAIIEFEQAAKYFMDSTLRLVKELRPHATWGFYHFPYCNNGKEPQRACSPVVEASNENITWLFDSSTALYPSIYLHGQETEMREYVNGVVTEALRVRKLSNNKFADIFPYTRYLYSGSELFFTKKDLNATILQSAQMGCSGVVFWGSKNDTHTAESCSQLQSYLQVSLGPWVKRVTDAASLCSLNICSANGRCVGDILTCASSWQKLEGKGTHEKEMLGRRDDRGQQSLFPCTCDCYEGWSGSSCNISG